jgi:hypothetical protein
VLTRCDLLNIQRWAHTVHKIFKEMMRFVEILTEFLAPFFRVFPSSVRVRLY